MFPGMGPQISGYDPRGVPVYSSLGYVDEYSPFTGTPGWVYNPAMSGGSDTDATPEFWSNMSTGERLFSNPINNVQLSPNYFSVGGQAVSRGGDNDPGPNYSALMEANRTADMKDLDLFLQQAIDPNVLGQGIDFSPYMQGVNIDPMGSTNNQSIANNINAANTLLGNYFAQNPGHMRQTPFGSWTPWTDFNDWNNRNNIISPDEGWGSMFKAPFEAAKDLAHDQKFMTALAIAAGGAGLAGMTGAGANASASAAGLGAGEGAGIAAGMTEAASALPSAAVGGTAASAPFMNLNPMGGTVGLNPVSSGVGFQATPEAIAAFEEGINIPGLAGASTVGGAAAGATIDAGVGQGIADGVTQAGSSVGMPSLGTIKDTLGLGSGLYSLYQGNQSAQAIQNALNQSNQQAQQDAFPHSQYRGLVDMYMNDPMALLRNNPGFLASQDFLMKQGLRQGAAKGQTNSGNINYYLADVLGRNAQQWWKDAWTPIREAAGVENRIPIAELAQVQSNALNSIADRQRAAGGSAVKGITDFLGSGTGQKVWDWAFG